MKKIFGLAFGLFVASGGFAGAQVVSEVQTSVQPAGANTGLRRDPASGSDSAAPSREQLRAGGGCRHR
jgi:hypothetical protein